MSGAVRAARAIGFKRGERRRLCRQFMNEPAEAVSTGCDDGVHHAKRGHVISPKCWAVFVARVVFGLIFFAAGFWKVFSLGAAEHARGLFVEPYASSPLPEWSLWLAGVAVPYVELIGGALMLAGWKRLAAAVGLGAVLILVTFGHLLADPLYAFNAHVIPRAVLLVIVLAMFDEDRLSLDSWQSRRRRAAAAAS